jgi:ribonuclease HII
MLIAGVDEAWRGCVIGPLVVAGVAVASENIQSLIDLGVKDSKLLTAKKKVLHEILKLTQNII